VIRTRIEIFRKIKIAESTHRKRTRRDIPLLILPMIKKSIVHWKKTSIEKAPATRISIAMRKIVTDTTKINVISKFFHVFVPSSLNNNIPIKLQPNIVMTRRRKRRIRRKLK